MMLEQWSHSMPAVIQRLIHGGYLAVQTFFILSGFVLAQTYASTKWNRESLTKFGMARIARIYPAYILSMLVVGRFVLETMAKPNRTPLQKTALLGDYAFLLLGWMGSLSVGWNTPAWSLSCELFFYLCFPLLFLWLRKAGLPKILLAFVISFVVPIALAHAGVPPTWKPIVHLSDFLGGIAAAGLFSKINLRQRGQWLYLPAMAAGIALIAYPEVLTGSLIDLNTALRPLNIIALIGFALSGGYLARLLSTPVAEYLGKASYSLYILHVPLLWWYSRYALHLLGAPPHTTSAVAFITGTVLISMAAYEYVEAPANIWLRNWTNERLAAQPAAVEEEEAVPVLSRTAAA
jgi:peptidoglycan/LPS O-acetylase OafA/YrhL